MYAKILVPLDGSELALCSLEHLKQATLGAGVPEVILLRVVEPISIADASVWFQLGLTSTEAQKKHILDAKDYLSKVAQKLNSQGISARFEVIEGEPAGTILDYSQKNKVDLIIISTHGRSGISRWAFGSVADRVVRHSTIPVLVISPPNCRSGN